MLKWDQADCTDADVNLVGIFFYPASTSGTNQLELILSSRWQYCSLKVGDGDRFTILVISPETFCTVITVCSKELPL